ncbi:MAG: hypothetical protein OEW05_07435 [Candidatus Aminicenantes bacterium]|nr:hypothetical protein [Candidatus Aminicenantes bacterium]
MRVEASGTFFFLLLGLGLFAATLAVPVVPAASGGIPQQALTAPGPLSAAHAKLEGAPNCAKCHESGKAIIAEKCLACHDKIAARIAAGKGVHRDVTGDCEVCHVEHQGLAVDLRPLEKDSFEHREEAGFPLEGKHAPLAKDCGACHRTRSFLELKPACDSCHGDPHQGAMTETCTACHTPAGWPNAARDFHKAGPFPLEGRHLTVPCASCHIGGVVKGTPRRCYDCHWIRRQDDRYRTRLGSECEACHRPMSWLAVNWDHGARTGQALNGPHRTLNCDACHKDGVFKGASFDCYSCHREDYEEARDPNHWTAGFPTSCQLCHLPSHVSFSQGRFNHAGVYPLQGVHATQSCAACHKNDVYLGTARDCYGCHRADYEQTRDPNHPKAGFPTTCELCHKASDSDWDRGQFKHNATYGLQGVHTTLDCGACHKNNVYRGTARECYGCHRTKYEQTQDPNHPAAGFPTTCEICHRAADASWNQGRFNHTWFPITSGRHAGNACSACHPNAGNYQVFSCLTCHSRGDTDGEHQGRAGYVYDSAACYSCHPQGRG